MSSATILDGALLAEQMMQQLQKEVTELRATGITPGLGTILVGDDPSSARYVALKHDDCARVGIASFRAELPADCSDDDLHETIMSFNANPAIDAYLLQLPIPRQLDEEAALLAIDPDKDADGLHPLNLGRLVLGEPGPLPCTPAAIIEMLRAYAIPVEGRHVLVIGRGLTIGRPLALLLTLKRAGCNAAVTVVHTGVADLAPYCQAADIVIAAAGSPGIVTKEMIKPGAVVIGAGTTYEGRKLLSDVNDDVAEVASFITPRLGGVGPMTRAMLLTNALNAARRRPDVTG